MTKKKKKSPEENGPTNPVAIAKPDVQTANNGNLGGGTPSSGENEGSERGSQAPELLPSTSASDPEPATMQITQAADSMSASPPPGSPSSGAADAPEGTAVSHGADPRPNGDESSPAVTTTATSAVGDSEPSVGERIKKVATDHVLFVIIGIFVAGVVFMGGVYGFFKPWLVEKEVTEAKNQVEDFKKKVDEADRQVAVLKKKNNLAGTGHNSTQPQPLKFPAKISVFAPLSGDWKLFGLSHSRAMIGALRHGLEELYSTNADDWKSYFTIEFIDTNEYRGKAGRDKLAEDFQTAQSSRDVIFGPMDSETAVDLLIRRKIEVKRPTILTTAASSEIRNHPQYGTAVMQLSANIDAYTGQLIRYLFDFQADSRRSVASIYQSDAYGQRSNKLLLDNCAARNRTHAGFEFQLRDSGQSVEQHRKNMQAVIENASTTWKDQDEKWIVVLTAVGDDLREQVKYIRSKWPKVLLATVTSIEREDLETGDFSGVYVLYSFAPRQYSVQTLSFYRHMTQATELAKLELPKRFIPEKWHRVNTVDAEVHDAVIYWMEHYLPSSFPNGKRAGRQQVYVTDFVVKGSAREFGNYGSLYLFRIEGTTMKPVEVPVD